MKKIKKGDEIIILCGKEKNKIGKIIKILNKKNKVIVEGLNIIKKHVKPDPKKGIDGGIIQKESPIHISNVALYNPETKKADRIGIKINKKGQKIRYFKSNGHEI